MNGRLQALGPSARIVARSRCAFDRVALARADRKGLAAARLAAKSASRFAPGCRALIVPDADAKAAGVWTWPDDHARPDALMIPETRLQAPGTDGARLVACEDGFDGQAWRGGDLVASRWWAEAPSDDDWRVFLSATDAEAGGPVPPATPPAIRPAARPAPRVPRDAENLAALTSPRRVGVATALAAALVVAFQAGGWLVASAAVGVERERLAEVSDAATEAERARRIAVSTARRATLAAGGADPGAAADAILSVLGALPASDVGLRRISIEDGRIEVTARTAPDAAFDVPALVTALERDPRLDGASARSTARSGEFVVEADLPAFADAGGNP